MVPVVIQYLDTRFVVVQCLLSGYMPFNVMRVLEGYGMAMATAVGRLP